MNGANGCVARRIAATGDASRRQTALVLAQTLVQVPADERHVDLDIGDPRCLL